MTRAVRGGSFPRTAVLHAAALSAISAAAVLNVSDTRGAERVSAEKILSAAGVKGGLIVHLGCGDGKLTAALKVNDGCVVQALDTDQRSIEKAREHINSLGLYGKVSAGTFDGSRLPYIDGLVNLLVVS